MSKRKEENNEYSDDDEGGLFDSDVSESEELDEYDIHASNALADQPLSINMCKKLESLSSNKLETALKKLSTILSAYEYDGLCHLVTVLLVEYYHSGWSVSDDTYKTIESTFSDYSSDANDDDDYWAMVDKCKDFVTKVLNSEKKLLPIASKLLYEVYFGEGGCVFKETYQFINEFLSKLS